MKPQTAIILINIGSPDSPHISSVRKYLKEFLTDKRVIEMPALFRYLLVYGIIAPFRSPKSAKKYREVWTDSGSPLMVHSQNLQQDLQDNIGDKSDVYLAMRYGNPGIKVILKEIEQKNYDKLVIVPLYPQYAASTTGTAIDKVMKSVSKWNRKPEIVKIGAFYNHTAYLSSLAEKVESYQPAIYDHILISFHGLPLKQVYKAHSGETCDDVDCANKINAENHKCYQAQCYHTARLLTEKLNLIEKQYTVAFQSRFSKNWLEPFTDNVLEQLAEQGKKKILVVCPSFIADCLETLHEIEIEYKEVFLQKGGEQLTMVPALNSDKYWVKALDDIINDSI